VVTTLTTPLPILIIGAGPVGLSLALALARQGLPVELFEALPALSPEIRASTFHPPTLEMFAGWGVVDNILAQGQMVDRLLYWERQSRELIAEFHYDHIAADTPFPFRLQCPQAVLTRTLKPLVEALPAAHIHMNHRLVGFQTHSNGVEAELETANGRITVQGAYLCGADGAGSTVRKGLEIGFEGMTYEDRFLLIGTDLDLHPYFPAVGPVNYLYDPDEWVIILHLADVVRVVFRLRPEEVEEEAVAETAVRQRINNFIGQPVDFTIKSSTVYRVHQRVADTFHQGPVLLLGDAAHINNPAGGMGMNSGIHDAYHLAQALTAVYRQGTDDPLHTYNHSRRQTALAGIRAYSDKNYADLSARDEAYRRRRNAQLRAAAADPVQARAYLLRASMMAERI
jgi:3-(3-hydroxy-phenyl)propionate hydroxylase